jgi:hypothetical protein
MFFLLFSVPILLTAVFVKINSRFEHNFIVVTVEVLYFFNLRYQFPYCDTLEENGVDKSSYAFEQINSY